jgi:CDP-diglyceride synthetase
MNELIAMVSKFAPAIGTALGGPLGGLAVSALSKQFGVKDEVDAVMKAINKDPEAEAKIRQLEHDKFKALLEDKSDARKREVDITASANAPLLNKIVTPALALGVTALSFVLFTVLIFVEVKTEAKDILIYILGVLSAAVTQILSYYFGSSMGSKDKGDQLRSAVK